MHTQMQHFWLRNGTGSQSFGSKNLRLVSDSKINWKSLLGNKIIVTRRGKIYVRQSWNKIQGGKANSLRQKLVYLEKLSFAEPKFCSVRTVLEKKSGLCGKTWYLQTFTEPTHICSFILIIHISSKLKWKLPFNHITIMELNKNLNKLNTYGVTFNFLDSKSKSMTSSLFISLMSSFLQWIIEWLWAFPLFFLE